MNDERTLIVVVTGMSGAGRSTAVHALEDLGFFCVDNVPTPVVPATLAAFEQGGVRRIALGVDARVRSFLADAPAMLDGLAEPPNRDVAVLFLDAANELLVRRFSSTRRPHPLDTLARTKHVSAMAVLDGIRMERDLLVPLRARATAVIDTSDLSVHDLRRQIVAMFGPGSAAEPRMSTRVVSFGFKFGPPSDADLVFDVRFLKNPYFEDALRELSGLDAPVRDFVLNNPEATAWLERITPLLEFCLPRFEREGKSYLTIAVGCTGGRHRSVALAERIAAEMGTKLGFAVRAVHRDLDRANPSTRPAESEYPPKLDKVSGSKTS
jgi:UPF0042 nucleotide-binding protein